MEIRQTSLSFSEASDEGPLTARAEVTFPRDVDRVTAGITGYTATFENEEDHHLGRLEVEVNATIDSDDPTKVIVTGVFGLRDWSNEFDDPYSGLVEVAVLAELVPVLPPRPGDARGDLIVTGAELTQAIQHFRSDDHLDASNVFPDNSIRLIAGKPTIVRLYVDYDSSSRLPPINTLSGSLTLFNPGGSTTLAPLQSIAPRRDVSINRAIRNHTLNFLIPDTDSIGQVNLFATVFDAADVTQKSAPFERTIQFDQQPPLRVIAVGINYTGDDVKDNAAPEDLEAPTEADFVDTFEFTDRIFPIPSITISDHRTMDYDEDVESDINDGCDKLDDLRDAVSDFVGDSDDIVYGLFGPGLETGSVGGCGGGGVGVSFVNRGGTAAHEIGHALGRKHAPCDNVTRCATPLNTDGNYPFYSGYDSDSIGEYGFDPTSVFGTVRDPSTSHDLMGYSGGRWISPYTYKALMNAVPGSSIPGAAALAATAPGQFESDNEWLRVKQQKLFLRLDIDRDGPKLHPSFHYDALPRPVTGDPTDYILEVVDAEGHRLRRVCLHAVGPGCGCGDAKDFPIRIRQAVAFDKRAAGIVLYRCDERLAEWEVPEPPEVDVDCRPDKKDPEHAVLSWKIKPVSGKASKDVYWSLVQWQDRFGTWRGVAPRLTGNQLRVPRFLPGMGNDLGYRVLVTTQIATGIGHWEGPCGDDDYRPNPPEVVLVGAGRTAGTYDLPRIATATTVGGGDLRGSVRWFDSAGGELARGNRLDLAKLKHGTNVVAATVIGSDVTVPTAQWLIERTEDDRFLLHVGNIGGEVPAAEDEPHIDHEHPHDDHHHHPHTHHEGE